MEGIYSRRVSQTLPCSVSEKSLKYGEEKRGERRMVLFIEPRAEKRE